MPDWIIQTILLVVAFGAFLIRQDKNAGERFARLETKVDDLRAKQEKYNNMQERLFKVEERAKLDGYRIDKIEARL